MKKTTINSTLIFVLFTTLLIKTSSFSTKKPELKDFKIIFQTTENGLKLIGEKGTAFKELTFTIKENAPQGIDEFGMTTEESKKDGKDEKLAHFEFTVEKTNNGFSLIGKKGTAWTKLGFTFGKKDSKAFVDQFGLTVK